MTGKEKFSGSSEYVVSDELMRAVNIAMALEKPLLIKGEPGTGKTMLAEAISKSLNKDLVIWNIKSTTKAQDGLYVYDVVQRLYDSQFGGEGVDDIKKYVKLLIPLSSICLYKSFDKGASTFSNVDNWLAKYVFAIQTEVNLASSIVHSIENSLIMSVCAADNVSSSFS